MRIGSGRRAAGTALSLRHCKRSPPATPCPRKTTRSLMCHVERTIRLHASAGSGKHFCLQTQQEGIQDTRADTVPVLHEHTSSCGSNSGRVSLPSQVVDNDHAITSPPHRPGRCCAARQSCEAFRARQPWCLIAVPKHCLISPPTHRRWSWYTS